jgi:hypothetical protein
MQLQRQDDAQGADPSSDQCKGNFPPAQRVASRLWIKSLAVEAPPADTKLQATLIGATTQPRHTGFLALSDECHALVQGQQQDSTGAQAAVGGAAQKRGILITPGGSYNVQVGTVSVRSAGSTSGDMQGLACAATAPDAVCAPV